MIIDLLFLIVLLVFMLRGYRKGLILSLFSVVAIFIGIAAALKLSGSVAERLFDADSSWSRWAPLLSYVIVFFIVIWLVKIAGTLLQKSFEAVTLGWVNRLTGALLHGFLVCFVFSTLLWLLAQMGVLHPEAQSHSRVFSLLTPLAPALFDWVGKVIPLLREVFQDLEHFFDHLNEKLPGDVGVD